MKLLIICKTCFLVQVLLNLESSSIWINTVAQRKKWLALSIIKVKTLANQRKFSFTSHWHNLSKFLFCTKRPFSHMLSKDVVMHCPDIVPSGISSQHSLYLKCATSVTFLRTDHASHLRFGQNDYMAASGEHLS